MANFITGIGIRYQVFAELVRRIFESSEEYEDISNYIRRIINNSSQNKRLHISSKTVLNNTTFRVEVNIYKIMNSDLYLPHNCNCSVDDKEIFKVIEDNTKLALKDLELLIPFNK